MAARDTETVLKRYRLTLLIYGYTTLALLAFRSVLFVSGPVDLLLDLSAAVFFGLACLVDSRIVSAPIPLSARWYLLGWTCVGPVYCLWSRGPRGLLWILLHGGLVFFTMIFGALLGAIGWIAATAVA